MERTEEKRCCLLALREAWLRLLLPKDGSCYSVAAAGRRIKKQILKFARQPVEAAW